MAAKPFLDEIETLKADLDAQRKVTQEVSRRAARLLTLIDDQDSEIAELKADLQKARARKKIEPKRD